MSCATLHVVVGAADVAVASGLGEGVSCYEEAGAWEDTLVDCLLEGELGAAAVADSGEAAVEHLGGDVGLAQEGDVVEVAKGHREAIEARDCDEVDVRVEEAWAYILA